MSELSEYTKDLFDDSLISLRSARDFTEVALESNIARLMKFEGYSRLTKIYSGNRLEDFTSSLVQYGESEIPSVITRLTDGALDAISEAMEGERYFARLKQAIDKDPQDDLEKAAKIRLRERTQRYTEHADEALTTYEKLRERISTLKPRITHKQFLIDSSNGETIKGTIEEIYKLIEQLRTYNPKDPQVSDGAYIEGFKREQENLESILEKLKLKEPEKKGKLSWSKIKVSLGRPQPPAPTTPPTVPPTGEGRPPGGVRIMEAVREGIRPSYGREIYGGLKGLWHWFVDGASKFYYDLKGYGGIIGNYDELEKQGIADGPNPIYFYKYFVYPKLRNKPLRRFRELLNHYVPIMGYKATLEEMGKGGIISSMIESLSEDWAEDTGWKSEGKHVRARELQEAEAQAEVRRKYERGVARAGRGILETIKSIASYSLVKPYNLASW